MNVDWPAEVAALRRAIWDIVDAAAGADRSLAIADAARLVGRSGWKAGVYHPIKDAA